MQSRAFQYGRDTLGHKVAVGTEIPLAKPTWLAPGGTPPSTQVISPSPPSFCNGFKQRHASHTPETTRDVNVLTKDRLVGRSTTRRCSLASMRRIRLTTVRARCCRLQALCVALRADTRTRWLPRLVLDA